MFFFDLLASAPTPTHPLSQYLLVNELPPSSGNRVFTESEELSQFAIPTVTQL